MLMVREAHPTDNKLWMILTMSNYRRANTNGGTYFFTVVTYRRQGFLCNNNVREALRDGIRYVQTTYSSIHHRWLGFVA